MHWDIRQARTFIAVAEARSFSVAAGLLHTTQSAVSRTIAKMEADIELPLLARSTRSVDLTHEGKLLLEECREVVAHFDRWIRRARRVGEGIAGEVSVGVNDFAIQAEVPYIISRFRVRFPEIRFRFLSATREDQTRGLEQGTIDVAFCMGPLNLPGYRSVQTGRYRLDALLHASHPLAKRDSLTIADLAQERFILGEEWGWKTFNEFLRQAFDSAGVPLRIGQHVAESVSIFGLVAAGCGISIYPDCQQYMTLRDVARIMITDMPGPIGTLAVWSDGDLPQATRHFVDFLRAEYETSLPDIYSQSA